MGTSLDSGRAGYARLSSRKRVSKRENKINRHNALLGQRGDRPSRGPGEQDQFNDITTEKKPAARKKKCQRGGVRPGREDTPRQNTHTKLQKEATGGKEKKSGRARIGNAISPNQLTARAPDQRELSIRK